MKSALPLSRRLASATVAFALALTGLVAIATPAAAATPPVIAVQPASVSVAVGATAEFTVVASGDPAPTITWQSLAGEAWTDVVASATTVTDAGRLSITNAQLSQTGTQYRAAISNEAGTVTTDPATLTVTETAVPNTVVDGVVLEWTGNAEMQKMPFAGGSNYFSAGVSDGSVAGYAATSGNTTIVQRAADGTEATAAYATRAAHVTGAGRSAQIVRLGGGHASFASDGSGSVTWTGSWSVNFYGGMVPFTISDPVLTVNAAGAGTLTGRLSGYASDQANPTIKTPIPAVAGVTIATFTGVKADLATGFSVTPAYAGVPVAVPAGETAQSRTAAGWGAWPQSFVDFHVGSGLSSYWYSSGGSLDAYKAPSPFAVSIVGAASPLPDVPVTVPVTIPTPTPTDDDGDDDEETTTPDKITTKTTAGSLYWGVKSSFRSYIVGSIAHGSIVLSDGAASKSGTYWFGQKKGGTFSAKKGTGTALYRGAVHFSGHGGILDLTLSNPVVRIDSAKKATLLVSVNGGSRIEFGSVDLSAADRTRKGKAVSYAGAPVSLTQAGADAFAYGSSRFYSAGTPMDSVSFTIGSPAKTVPKDTTAAKFTSTTFTPPAETPATEGVETDLSEYAPGDAFTATASGFEPNEIDIAVVIYSSPTVMSTEVTANAEGVVNYDGIIPIDLEDGDHTITVQGSVDRGTVVEVAAATEEKCAISDATLTWGFKESFRSYISGAIANGKWDVADGAAYETPDFSWSAGTGSFDPSTFAGLVTFEGSIRFTGHDGILDTTVANPQILFVDESTAYILLDVSGPTMDGDPVDEKAVSFVELDLAAGNVDLSKDGVITATDVPTAITSEGYSTFPNYEAGTEFDPVSFTIATDVECAAAVSTPTPVATATSEPAPVVEPASSADWIVPVVVGAIVVLLLIAALVIVLVARRRRRA